MLLWHLPQPPHLPVTRRIGSASKASRRKSCPCGWCSRTGTGGGWSGGGRSAPVGVPAAARSRQPSAAQHASMQAEPQAELARSRQPSTTQRAQTWCQLETSSPLQRQLLPGRRLQTSHKWPRTQLEAHPPLCISEGGPAKGACCAHACPPPSHACPQSGCLSRPPERPLLLSRGCVRVRAMQAPRHGLRLSSCQEASQCSAINLQQHMGREPVLKEVNP